MTDGDRCEMPDCPHEGVVCVHAHWVCSDHLAAAIDLAMEHAEAQARTEYPDVYRTPKDDEAA